MLIKKFSPLITLCILILLILACSESIPTSDTSPDRSDEKETAVVFLTPAVKSDQYRVFVPNIKSSDLSTPADIPNIPSGFDPHVILEMNADSINIGDTLIVVGRPVQIGSPTYYLVVRDEGVQDAPPMFEITFENVTTKGTGTSQILEFLTAQADTYQATFSLRAKALGRTTVTIVAIGDLQTGYPEPGVVRGEGSGSILITVGGG